MERIAIVEIILLNRVSTITFPVMLKAQKYRSMEEKRHYLGNYLERNFKRHYLGNFLKSILINLYEP